MNRIEDTLTNALNTLRTTRLPDEARSRMRDELLSYASLHEFAPEAVPTRTAVRSPFSIFQFRVYSSFAAVLLIVASLGGTAFASEHALPGDALYSVKVGIAEPIQTALVPSDRGKAAWHAILAERRLDETAQLAARGTLSTETQSELAANFDSQVTASEKSADRLEHTGDTSGSLSVRSDLEARLNAHTHILSVIAAHFALATSSDAEGTHTALERMLAVVSDHQKTIVSARLALEDAINPRAGSTDSATSTAKIAVAMRMPGRIRINANATPEAQVMSAAEVRTEEEQHILDRHAMFLAKFMPISTTTATTTATTTTATSTTTTTVSTTTVERPVDK